MIDDRCNTLLQLSWSFARRVFFICHASCKLFDENYVCHHSGWSLLFQIMDCRLSHTYRVCNYLSMLWLIHVSKGGPRNTITCQCVVRVAQCAWQRVMERYATNVDLGPNTVLSIFQIMIAMTKINYQTTRRWVSEGQWQFNRVKLASYCVRYRNIVHLSQDIFTWHCCASFG